jgi:hypothetical protein
VALQNIATSLMTDFVAQVVERTNNPPLAPRSIFLSHSNDQFLKDSICAGPASGQAAPRAVELPGEESSVPGENCFGRNDLGGFIESSSCEPFANLGQAHPV